MATTVDNLITNYILNDRYTPALQRIAAQTNLTTAGIGNFSGSLGGLTASLGLSAGALTALSVGITAVLGGLTALSALSVTSAIATYRLGSAALKQAADMEQLVMTLAALRNSTDSAAEGFRFLERFATQSVFEFSDLAEAGVQIEAFGLRMERVLPLISQVGAAFGAKPEKLQQLASAFGRIASGQTGEAMQQLRSVGISNAALAAQGIKFTKGGEAQATPEEMLIALERVIQSRFGRINEMMSDTLSVSLSNIMDGINQSLTKIGNALMPIVKPLLAALKQFSQFLAAGGIDAIVQPMTRAFAAIRDLLGGPEGVLKIATWIIAIFSVLPDIVAIVAKSFKIILESVATVFGWIFKNIGIIENLLRGLTGASGFIDFGKMIAERQQELFNKFLAFSAPESATVADTGGFFRSENPLQTEYAKQTAENTKQIADELKLQRFALGGGTLGARGLSPITRQSLNNARPISGMRSFEQVIERLIDEYTRRRR